VRIEPAFMWPVRPGDLLNNPTASVWPVFIVAASEPLVHNNVTYTIQVQMCVAIVADELVMNVAVYSDDNFVTLARA
jgi:hypothetical protein